MTALRHFQGESSSLIDRHSKVVDAGFVVSDSTAGLDGLGPNLNIDFTLTACAGVRDVGPDSIHVLAMLLTLGTCVGESIGWLTYTVV